MTNTPPFHHTAESGAQVLTLTVPPCACGLCRSKADSQVGTCHAGMSEEKREAQIRELGEDAQLYKDLAGGLADDKDRAYWCKQAFDATQARDALIAGRK